MKVTFRIATGTYEFMELEGGKTDIPYMLKAQNEYSEKPVQFSKGNRQLITAFVGGDIYYDALTHEYTNEAGEHYISGSEYAKKFAKPFDGKAISEAMAKKRDVNGQDIRDMWQLKSDISTGFGTAIHAALELYGRFDGLAKTLEKTTHLHDHPIIKKAVEDFYKGREKEVAAYEPVIVDHAHKRAGRIDRLLLLGEKRCRVQDYKTNALLPEEKLNEYWEQLKFYAGIMIADGWTVEGLDVFHWDGEWHTYTKEATK